MTSLNTFWMIRCISIAFLLSIFNIAVSQDADSVKCWSHFDSLKWADFKGVVPLRQQNSFVRAVCSSKISVVPFREDGLLTYKVKVFFNKNKSWSKDTTKYMLGHEQLHFDIAELYARKLRNEIYKISSKIKNPTSNDFKQIVAQLLDEEGDRQINYDRETVHSMVLESQAEWKKVIYQELEQLKTYKSTVADCN